MSAARALLKGLTVFKSHRSCRLRHLTYLDHIATKKITTQAKWHWFNPDYYGLPESKWTSQMTLTCYYMYLHVHAWTCCIKKQVCYFGMYYTSITIVQSYTGKYHESVAVCIVTSVQHEYQCQRQQVIFFAWYYGDNDFMIRTFDFNAHSYVAHVTCSTWYGFSRDLQYWYGFSRDLQYWYGFSRDL